MPYLSDRRLYLTADKRTVVEHGDTRAAFLLAGEGGLISDTDAERYGLTHLPAVAPQPEVQEDRRLADWSHLDTEQPWPARARRK